MRTLILLPRMFHTKYICTSFTLILMHVHREQIVENPVTFLDKLETSRAEDYI